MAWFYRLFICLELIICFQTCSPGFTICWPGCLSKISFLPKRSQPFFKEQIINPTINSISNYSLHSLQIKYDHYASNLHDQKSCYNLTFVILPPQSTIKNMKPQDCLSNNPFCPENLRRFYYLLIRELNLYRSADNQHGELIIHRAFGAVFNIESKYGSGWYQRPKQISPSPFPSPQP